MINHIVETEQSLGEGIIAEGKNFIKACLFNLIVISEDLESAIHCQDLIRIVTEKFPCRIIFIRSDKAAQGDFFQETRSVHTIGAGSSRVCCDQLVIELSCNQLHKVPFIIFPQLVPDLPIYILLGKDPTEGSTVLAALQKYAARVIFDPQGIENYALFSEQMLTLFHEATVEFIDMHWARTRAWREVMARVFSTPGKLQELKCSKILQISYVGEPQFPRHPSEMQAVYLQAWLAQALGWKLISVAREGNGVLSITYKNDDKTVSVSIAPKDTGVLEQGATFSVEAMSYNESHVLISHETESKHVTVHASDLERCEMPYSLFLSNYQHGPALVSEIFYRPAGEQYRNMLKMLNQKEWSQ